MYLTRIFSYSCNMQKLLLSKRQHICTEGCSKSSLVSEDESGGEFNLKCNGIEKDLMTKFVWKLDLAFEIRDRTKLQWAPRMFKRHRHYHLFWKRPFPPCCLHRPQWYILFNSPHASMLLEICSQLGSSVIVATCKSFFYPKGNNMHWRLLKKQSGAYLCDLCKLFWYLWRMLLLDYVICM